MILLGNCSMRCSISCIPAVVRRWESGPNRPDFSLRRMTMRLEIIRFVLALPLASLRTPKSDRLLVLLQGDIDGFRATQMIQDKAQSAGNGRPFSRTATPYWIIWVAPFGRAGKRSSAVLRLLARADHSRRGAPCGQPLPDSLNPSISP